MEVCNACHFLNGRPSSTPPHPLLRLAGSGVFGTPARPVTRYLQCRCDDCGAWLHQNTDAGTPAERWSVRDADARLRNGDRLAARKTEWPFAARVSLITGLKS